MKAAPKTREQLIAENARMLDALRLIYREADCAIEREPGPDRRAEMESLGYIAGMARCEMELAGLRFGGQS